VRVLDHLLRFPPTDATAWENVVARNPSRTYRSTDVDLPDPWTSGTPPAGAASNARRRLEQQYGALEARAERDELPRWSDSPTVRAAPPADLGVEALGVPAIER
jgi:hypothetical protein